MNDEAWYILICMGNGQEMGMQRHLVCFDKVKRTHSRCIIRLKGEGPFA